VEVFVLGGGEGLIISGEECMTLTGKYSSPIGEECVILTGEHSYDAGDQRFFPVRESSFQIGGDRFLWVRELVELRDEGDPLLLVSLDFRRRRHRRHLISELFNFLGGSSLRCRWSQFQ
jgi:hypothetical protein